MKTKLFTTLSIFFLSSISLTAQNSSEQLDINNINARIGIEALFSDAVNGLHGFEFPKGNGKHTIFAGNLWMGMSKHLVQILVEEEGRS